jgi:hypothetical protein
MSYTIQLRIFQSSPARGLFTLVEETNWNFANGGTWSDTDGVLTLRMGGSGTSGVLRFKSDTTGEFITVAVGVHNYKRWCDVVTGLPSNQTALVVNGQYYNNGPRAYMREKQLASYGVRSARGTTVKVVYTVAEGNNLKANVLIA